VTTAVSPSSTTTELALTVELEQDSGFGLLRAISLLHRRRCRVVSVDYRSGAGPHDRLDLRVEAPPLHAHCVEAWLSALVEVRRVDSTSAS
jgi:hypothetical protein